MEVPHLTRRELLTILVEHNLNQHTLILKAFNQAIKSHIHQKRDDGSSYLEQHIYPIAHTLIIFCNETGTELTPTLIAGALLHDTLEDDPRIDHEQFKETFGEEMYQMVVALTKPEWKTFKGREKKMQANMAYLKQLKEAVGEVRIIKLADRLNNLQCLPTSPLPKKKEIYVKITKKYFLPLAEEFPWFLERIQRTLTTLK